MARSHLALALAALAVARLAFAATTEIVEDEAYYWVWSQHLAAGYFDHPPAIAWLIAASDAVFGATSLGVRAGPVLAATLAAAAVLPWVKDRALFLTSLATMPLYALGGVLATPDLPLIAGWTVALGGALGGNWVVAGLGAGLAGIGKYTGWGLWPLLLLAAPREWRRMLPGFALTLVILAPNLLWNARHDWVSLRFQLDHGLASREPAPVEFLLAQVGLVGPILFGAVMAWWATAWRGDRATRICWWTSFPVFAFFGLAATRSFGEANWPAAAWIGACAGLSLASGRVLRAAWVGVGLNLVIAVLLVVHAYRPLLEHPGDPTLRAGRGRALAESVQAWAVEPVYTERYQEAALIAYHQGVAAYALPGVGRPDQYDLWELPSADHALFVRPRRSGDVLPTDGFCASRGPANAVEERTDRMLLAAWQVYEVHGCVLP